MLGPINERYTTIAMMWQTQFSSSFYSNSKSYVHWNNKKIVKEKKTYPLQSQEQYVFQTNPSDFKIRTSARNFKTLRGKFKLIWKLQINSVSNIKQNSSDCVIIRETPLKISNTL